MPDYNIATVAPVQSVDWNNMADRLRQGAVNRVISRNMSDGTKYGTDAQGNRVLVPAGSLDESGFYQGLKDLGVGLEQYQGAMDWKKATNASDLNQGMTDTQMRALGYDPNAAARNNATIGAPAPVRKPSEKLAQWFSDEKEKRKAKYGGNVDQALVVNGTPTSSVEDTYVPSTQPTQPTQPTQSTTAPVESYQEQGQPLVTSSGMDLGAGKITVPGQATQTMQLPELQSEPIEYETPVDQRSARQVTQDSFDPANSLMNRGQQGGQNEPSVDLMKWEPQDDGTNQFQQYKQTLTSQLRASGFNSPSEYLQSVYRAKMAENMPPMPNAALQMQGVEGMAKYNGEVNAYTAGMQKAKGLAEQAVIGERAKLAEQAKQFGVNTVEQNKSQISDTEILRDPAKRNEAAALKTNIQNAQYAKEAVEKAGTNTSLLALAAPQVIRAYATSLNPGQQLSEGNLTESAQALFPEYGNNRNFMMKAVMALGRWLKDGDSSGVDQLLNAVDASAPEKMQQRLLRMAEEAQVLTRKNYGNYVVQGKAPEAEVTKQTPEKPSVRQDLTDRIKNKAPNKVKKPSRVTPNDPLGIL